MNRFQLNIKDKTAISLEKNIKNRFKELISKPRIAIKSFAQIKLEEELQEIAVDSMLSPTFEVSNLLQTSDSKNVTSNLPNKSPKQEDFIEGSSKHSEEESRNTLTKIPSLEQEIFSEQRNIEKNLLKESEKTINESIFCELCNETFKNNVDFSVHSIKHNDNKKYSCHACDYNTISEKSIKRHVKIHERKILYKCEICDKGFAHNRQAIDHKNFHTGVKPFVCDICGKAYSSAVALAQHRRDLHWKTLGLTPTTYDCKVCDKTYASSNGFKRHFERHHTQDFDESELCDICGRRLANKKSLKYHKRTHTGYKPHVCSVCEKRFCKKELLTEHMRVHSGEKPFKCKHCAKGFTQRTSCKIHERIHTKERPYVCRLCKKGFISKGVMDLHLKRCEGFSGDLD